MNTSRLQFAQRGLSARRNKTGLVFREILRQTKKQEELSGRLSFCGCITDPKYQQRPRVWTWGQEVLLAQMVLKGRRPPPHKYAVSPGTRKGGAQETGPGQHHLEGKPPLGPEPRHAHLCFNLRGICPHPHKINTT